jgi:hypothetical protein
LFDLIWRQKEFGLNFFILFSTTPKQQITVESFVVKQGGAMASSSKSSGVLPWLEGLQLSCQSRALLPLTDVLQSLSILASSSSCILA